MPRLLGLLNRNILSKTYGCFDRQYWHYNTADFSCARSQEAVLTLALLYKIKNKKNPYYDNPNILNWVNAAIDFWTEIQEKNGSFNEWYPKESSFVATAFSSYAISETLLLLKNRVKDDTRKRAITALIKSGDWISKKNEKRALNQESGSAIALLNIYLLTNHRRYKNCAKNKINFILKNQTKEGWFSEYGGPDIGYLSLTIDYLSKYYKKTNDEKVLKILNKTIGFISYFIHPDLTAGGEYGSRNTEYLIPDGFEIMANKNKLAAGIAHTIRKSLKSKVLISPHSLDDRYLTYICYTWLQAAIDNSKIKNYRLRNREKFTKNFKEAKIYIYSDNHRYLIINYGKGGCFKLFSNSRSFYDGGLSIETSKGRITSALLTNKNNAKINGKKLVIEGPMWKIADNLLTPRKNVMLRAFQTTVGKNERLSLFLKDKLRNKLITQSKITNFIYRREITIEKKAIKVIDFLKGNGIKKVIIGSKSPDIYVPSSRYFQITDLKNELFEFYPKTNRIKILRKYDNNGKLNFLTK